MFLPQLALQAEQQALLVVRQRSLHGVKGMCILEPVGLRILYKEILSLRTSRPSFWIELVESSERLILNMRATLPVNSSASRARVRKATATQMTLPLFKMSLTRCILSP